MSSELKTKTAHSLKWNIIDRVATQVLYAITGIVLARLLTQEDFGLVGAVLVFQAFGSLLVDSGFSYALLQRKNPEATDYSTVFWFNLAVSLGLYVILFFCAPLIALCFGNNAEIIPLGRAMFVVLPLNALAIVQTNRLMKAMDVRLITVSNSVALVCAGVAGIVLAVCGFGAWAIVWQGITLSAVKSIVLWTGTAWRPAFVFSWRSLRSFFSLGSKMMFSSFLNTVFQNIYSFFIGNRVGLVSLGYYTQSDKWSKMGITALTQVFTSTFIPTLSAVQDDAERFRRLCSKMTRFTAYASLPALLGLAVMARPLFHTLFGLKWDASIILFQLLLVRGVFTVFNSLASNFLLALGKGATIVRLEVVRDVAAIVALAITFPYMALALPGNPVWGVTVMLWVQLAATVLTWIVTVWATLRSTGIKLGSYLSDICPYLMLTFLAVIACYAIGTLQLQPWIILLAECVAGLTVYVALAALLGSKIQREAFAYIWRTIAKK